MSCFLFGGFVEDLLKARHRGPRSKTEKDGEAHIRGPVWSLLGAFQMNRKNRYPLRQMR